MPDKGSSARIRRAANVSIDAALLDEAKTLGVNVSRACEAGLAVEVKAGREARWLKENQEAIEGWNRWIEENGLPLADLRLF